MIRTSRSFRSSGNFAKANGLPGHIVASQLRANIDPYEGIDASLAGIDLRRLRKILAIPLKTLRTALVPQSMWRVSSRFLRYCPPCMSRGYHGVAHQLQSLQNCPIHKTPLEFACRFCGYEAAYRLSALLLNSPYRCAHCRRPYGNSEFYVAHRTPMNKKVRRVMERLHLRHLFF